MNLSILWEYVALSPGSRLMSSMLGTRLVGMSFIQPCQHHTWGLPFSCVYNSFHTTQYDRWNSCESFSWKHKIFMCILDLFKHSWLGNILPRSHIVSYTYIGISAELDRYRLRVRSYLITTSSLRLWLKIPPEKICFDMIWPSMFVSHGVQFTPGTQSWFKLSSLSFLALLCACKMLGWPI